MILVLTFLAALYALMPPVIYRNSELKVRGPDAPANPVYELERLIHVLISPPRLYFH